MGKKKRDIDEGPGADVGAVMTVSLFLILLTFFILLNSIAVIDDNRSRVAIGSLLGAFGSLSGGLSPMKTGESIMPPSAPMTSQDLTINDLLSMMDKKMMDNIRVESRRNGQSVITIEQEALFDDKGARLRPDSYPILDRLCQFIRKGDYPVEIIGHTDNRPAEEKGYRSNWQLSALMSIRVLRYFVEKGKVPPERLIAYGRSSYEPIAPNDTPRSRARNRRVESVLNFRAPAYFKRIYKKKSWGIFTYKKFDFKVF